MEQSEQDLLFKSYLTQCLEHPLFQCIFLHLKKDAKRSKICSECKSESNLSDQDVFSIDELLTFPEKEIKIGFPFSNDPKLIEFYSKLKTTPDTMVEKIESFFDEIQMTINNKINEAKKSSLKKAAEIILQRQLLEKSFESITSSFSQLKEALLRFSEEDLNNFIKVKIESEEAKINKLKTDIDQYSKELAKFNLEPSLEKTQIISQIISNIDCFFVQEIPSLPQLDLSFENSLNWMEENYMA